MSDSPTDAFHRAQAVVAAASRIAIVTHSRADGDAIGSAAGLQCLLRAQGRRADGIVFEPPPPRYAFLQQREPLLVWDAAAREALDAADLWIMADTSAARQVEPIGPRLAKRTAKLLVIDHHRTRDIRGDAEIIDESAAACALIVLDWAEACGWAIPPAAADLLLAGLAADTGWFAYANADARVFEAAARLLRRGASSAALYERLYRAEQPARFRLFAMANRAATFEAGGRLAVLEVTRALLAECGATSAMTEDLVNEPLRIASVEASILLTDSDDGQIRISFRAKPGRDVATVAQQFGGGGHTLAAGGRTPGPMAAARQAVVAAMTQMLVAI